MAVLKIDWAAPDAVFNQIYELEVGDVFQFTRHPETVLMKVQSNKPTSLNKFEVKIATPGSEYFTMYGDNTCVVTCKVGEYTPPVTPTP